MKLLMLILISCGISAKTYASSNEALLVDALERNLGKQIGREQKTHESCQLTVQASHHPSKKRNLVVSLQIGNSVLRTFNSHQLLFFANRFSATQSCISWATPKTVSGVFSKQNKKPNHCKST